MEGFYDRQFDRRLLKRRFYGLQDAYERSLRLNERDGTGQALRRCVRLALCIARLERLLGHRG